MSEQTKDFRDKTQGINGIFLGVHEVFNASEQDDYLRNVTRCGTSLDRLGTRPIFMISLQCIRKADCAEEPRRG